jgi:hypothetical protein
MTTLQQDTDKLVEKYGFNRNNQHYGALDCVEEVEDLLEMRERLLDYLEQGMRDEYINKLHLLLEVEYQLTKADTE